MSDQLTYTVSVIGLEEFSATKEEVDFIDAAMASGMKWIIMPRGIRFAAHSLQSIKPKYNVTQWVRDQGGTAEEYKTMLEPKPTTKLLN